MGFKDFIEKKKPDDDTGMDLDGVDEPDEKPCEEKKKKRPTKFSEFAEEHKAPPSGISIFINLGGGRNGAI